MNYNSCTFMGRLSKDVDIKFLGDGKAVANFTLAVQRDFRNNDGDREADFLNFTLWGKPAENLADNAVKGDLIMVDSRAQVRHYEKDGQRVYVTEFIVNGFPKYVKLKKWENGNQSSTAGNGSTSSSNQNSNRDPFTNSQPIDINDDNLPF